MTVTVTETETVRERECVRERGCVCERKRARERLREADRACTGAVIKPGMPNAVPLPREEGTTQKVCSSLAQKSRPAIWPGTSYMCLIGSTAESHPGAVKLATKMIKTN